MINAINKQIRRALGHIRLPFRAVLTRLNTAAPISLVQAEGLNGEQLQDTELFQQYGFTSAPLEGCEKIVLPIGGKTAHGIIIACEDRRFRLRGLKSGEVALYTDEGDTLIFKRGRKMEIRTLTLDIDAGGSKLVMNSAGTTITTPAFDLVKS